MHLCLCTSQRRLCCPAYSMTLGPRWSQHWYLNLNSKQSVSSVAVALSWDLMVSIMSDLLAFLMPALAQIDPAELVARGLQICGPAM